MKSIVVYYSLDGSTKLIAEKIQHIFHSDLLEIKLAHEPSQNGLRRLFRMAWWVYAKRTPKLSEPLHSFRDYDKVFIGSPIWMGTMAPAIRTFISEIPLNEKMVIPFCTYDAEIGRYFEDLRKMRPLVKFSFGMGFKTPKDLGEEELEESIRVWLNNMR